MEPGIPVRHSTLPPAPCGGGSRGALCQTAQRAPTNLPMPTTLASGRGPPRTAAGRATRGSPRRAAPVPAARARTGVPRVPSVWLEPTPRRWVQPQWPRVPSVWLEPTPLRWAQPQLPRVPTVRLAPSPQHWARHHLPSALSVQQARTVCSWGAWNECVVLLGPACAPFLRPRRILELTQQATLWTTI